MTELPEDVRFERGVMSEVTTLTGVWEGTSVSSVFGPLVTVPE